MGIFSGIYNGLRQSKRLSIFSIFDFVEYTKKSYERSPKGLSVVFLN